MEEFFIVAIVVYLICSVLFGMILFERINPKGFNEISIFVVSCVFWWMVSLVILVLSLLSSIRKSKRKK